MTNSQRRRALLGEVEGSSRYCDGGGGAVRYGEPPARRPSSARSGPALDSLRRAELERHRAQLVDLSEVEWQQVDDAMRAALAKILQEPTVLLKDSAGSPRGDRLVEALRLLFSP